MIESKKILELFTKSKQRQIKDRYLFVVNNAEWVKAIMQTGKAALLIDGDYSLQHLITDLEYHKEALAANNIVIVPCLSKADNEQIATAIKDKLSYETDGYQIIKEPKLKQYEYKEELAAALDKYIENHSGVKAESTATPEEYSQMNNAAYLQSMLDKIEQSKTDAAILTGFNKLDEVLNGGLYGERLYVVAAITSLGKTTFVQNICDNIAKAGTDVLYFSLEMSRHELMAKSISRHTYLWAAEAGDIKYAKTALDIMAGKKYQYYTKDEREMIQIAIESYAQYSSRIITYEGIGDISVDDIKKAVKAHKELTGRKPVVIVDYLQIIAPRDEHASDKQNADFNILELKRLASSEKIPVICISSINRTNYLQPIALESIKESGNVEFSADAVIGLQFSVLSTEDVFNKDGSIKDKRDKINEAKAKQPREVDAVILKNRQGISGGKVSYLYYSAYNYFSEIGKTEAPKKPRVF